MRWMRASMILIAIVALLGLGMTFVVEASFAGRKIDVQPIERDAKSDTGWRLAGSVTPMMDIPPEAYVTKGSPGIPPQVDMAKLRGRADTGTYQMIDSTIHTARFGAMAAVFVGIVGFFALRRFAQPDLS